MDNYLTINSPAQGVYTEKRSKFLAFAFPVEGVEQIKMILADYQKKYFDARHLCYAYMLGEERKVFRANDNGEPSGTAGKPILGQINSNNLTNILIIVVRYFGGIKLGTSGLIQAYKCAAAEAIEHSQIVEKFVEDTFICRFDYLYMNDVMKVVKEERPKVMEQLFDNLCQLTLSTRKSNAPKLKERLMKISTLSIEQVE